MNTLQERLKGFIAHLDLSVLAFENKCGMAQGTVNKMTDKSRQRTLEKIRKTYPQLNMEWLLTGEGEMLVPGAVSALSGCSAPPTDLGKALDEIAAQRRLLEKSQEQIDRLISIIERMNERK